MIRLRPSELTLTPDDVEQTFRRIAQRQTSTPSLLASSSRTSAHPGQPFLRRGPQRSTRDAITILSDIPILRPRSQRALHASLDEDVEDNPTLLTDRRDSVTGTSPPQGHTSAHVPGPFVIRTLHLPFRLGRNRQSPSAQSAHDEELVRANSEPAIVNRTEQTDGADDSQGLPQSEFIIASDTHAELRGGGRLGKDRANPSTRGASQSPSPSPPSPPPPPPPQSQPLHSPLQRQTQSPTRRIVKIQESKGDPPTKILHGNFTGTGTEYSFEEFDLSYPFTEPRRGRDRNRWSSLRRSRSGSSVLALATPTRRHSGATRGLATATEPRERDRQGRLPPIRGTFRDSDRFPPPRDSRRYTGRVHSSSDNPPANPARPRSRQIGSSSSSSAAFSYYGSELLPSQNTSREPSAVDEQGSFEYDELLGWIRVSSTGSRQSIPASTPSGQFGVSPLPSSPYTRGQATHGATQASIGSNMGRSTMDGHTDAATAAALNRNSPLEGYSDQNQNLARGRPARQTMPAQPSPSQHPWGSLGSNSSWQGGGIPQQGTFPSPYQNPYPIPSQNACQSPYQTPYPSSYPNPYHSPYQSLYQSISGPSNVPQQQHLPQQQRFHQLQSQRQAHSQFQQQQQRHPQHNHSQSSPQHSSDHTWNASSQASQSVRRNTQLPRATQRSSENVPVDSVSSEGRTARNGQVQTQAAAYELLSNAAQASQPSHPRQPERGPSRLDAPAPALPRDISNRPRSQPPQPAPRVSARTPNTRMSGSPQPPSDARDNTQNEPSLRGGAPVPPRHTSRQHSADRPLRTHSRPHRGTQATAPPPLHLRPARSPLTALALDHGSGTTTRPSRSPLVRAGTPVRTQRRVPARQRNQENSGDVEMTAMRREEAAILARYSEEGRGEVMDETPPPVGRVERRMFE